MNTAAESDRIETLLALGLLFEDRPFDGTAQLFAPPAPLASLPPTDLRSIAERAAGYENLAPEDQARWLQSVLGRARRRVRGRAGAHLDQHIHPTHVAAALRREPEVIRQLILRHLAPSLAAAVAEDLGTQLTAAPERRVLRGERRRRQEPYEGLERRHLPERRSSPAAHVEQTTKLVAAVRRAFLSQFVHFDAIGDPTPMDALAPLELVRLIRLAGAREAAVACHNLEKVESIGQLLRRFPPEDARAVTAHLEAPGLSPAPSRVALAERVVAESIVEEKTPRALVVRIGLGVLAVALSAARTNELRRRYVAQKLPAAVAEELDRLIAKQKNGPGDDESSADEVAAEIEHLAAALRRSAA